MSRFTTKICLIFLAAALPGCMRARSPLAIPWFYQPVPAAAARTLAEAAPTTTAVEHIRTVVPEMPPPEPIAETPAEQLPEQSMTLDRALDVAIRNSEVVRVISGSASTAAGSTTYDPSVAETEIQTAMAPFDPVFSTSSNWSKRDNPPGRDLFGFLLLPQMQDTASFNSGISKTFSSGLQARASVANDYFLELLNNPRFAQYQTRTQLDLTQPLARGAGFSFNRAPLVIARANTNISQWDYRLAVMNLVRDVETSYWQLQAAEAALEARRTVLPLAQEVARVQALRFDSQKAVEADLAQALLQLASFNQQIIQAENLRRERELTLRNLLGLPPSDDWSLHPGDEPSAAPVSFDWEGQYLTALERRPEIMRQRLTLRVQEALLTQARNAMLPRIDGQAMFRTNGLGLDLEEALEMIGQNDYQDWTLGFVVEIPLHNRAASAQLRSAELNLSRQRALLRQLAHNTAHELNNAQRELGALREQYEIALDRLEQSRRWRDGTRARFENPLQDTDLVVALDTYLRALDAWAQAQSDVAALLAQYNSTLVRYETITGTVLETRGIMLNEDPAARARAFKLPGLREVLPAELLPPAKEDDAPEVPQEVPPPQGDAA